MAEFVDQRPGLGVRADHGRRPERTAQVNPVGLAGKHVGVVGELLSHSEGDRGGFRRGPDQRIVRLHRLPPAGAEPAPNQKLEARTRAFVTEVLESIRGILGGACEGGVQIGLLLPVAVGVTEAARRVRDRAHRGRDDPPRPGSGESDDSCPEVLARYPSSWGSVRLYPIV